MWDYIFAAGGSAIRASSTAFALHCLALRQTTPRAFRVCCHVCLCACMFFYNYKTI